MREAQRAEFPRRTGATACGVSPVGLNTSSVMSSKRVVAGSKCISLENRNTRYALFAEQHDDEFSSRRPANEHEHRLLKRHTDVTTTRAQKITWNGLTSTEQHCQRTDQHWHRRVRLPCVFRIGGVLGKVAYIDLHRRCSQDWRR